MRELDILRKKIREIDEKIVKLIKERFDIANEIGKFKKKFNLPVKNEKIEKEIIERGKKQASFYGISTQLIVDILENLMKESRHIQERLRTSKKERKNIFIVGAKGKMGQWFSNFFEREGHCVYKYDVNSSLQNDEWVDFKTGMEKSSFVLLATPIEKTGAIIEEIADSGYSGIVFDIASIKSPLLISFKKAIEKGLLITSTHPLFGPDAEFYSDKIFCVCDLGNRKANDRVKELFDDSSNVVGIPVYEHDKLISYILNLSHLVNINFVNTLRKSGFSYIELTRFGSTTFFSQIETSKSVINEDPDLYFSIQRYNENETNVLKKLKESLEEIENSILKGDKEKFKKIMTGGKKWIKG